jgi:NAD(P)-dependent dehydrogenase (short-subunit alcohol dehydrogenase family)
LRGEANEDDATRFTAHMLMEFARMSVEDGLVMQLHVGSDAGADIPVATEWTRNLRPLLAEDEAQAIEADGGLALALPADVLDRGELEAAREAVVERWGRIDVLVNAAGGNMPQATLEPEQSFFDLPVEGMEPVIALNLQGTLLPSQVFGEVMARAGRGCVVNISSMAAQRAMTRVAGYGAAKAAVENATRWLAVELARSFGEGMRVNAIAPGFFVGEQNRTLPLNEDGTLTARGQTIMTTRRPDVSASQTT